MSSGGSWHPGDAADGSPLRPITAINAAHGYMRRLRAHVVQHGCVIREANGRHVHVSNKWVFDLLNGYELRMNHASPGQLRGMNLWIGAVCRKRMRLVLSRTQVGHMQGLYGALGGHGE